MLFNNLTTERRASLLVKNSNFYIEIAKFVQAYTTIVKNPNEFLTEIGESTIDPKKAHLNWEQLVKIMQSVDLGFKKVPTSMDLVVYYNYALEMGSVKALEKKIASVDQVAEAQKHYYNFVDEEKTNAEEEYRKQKKILDARQREMGYVEGHISLAKAKNVACLVAMFLSVFIGMIGLVGFFVDNAIVSGLGKIISKKYANIIGSAILIIIALLLFAFFNHLYVKTKYDYVKLKNASFTIFAREDDLMTKQLILKKKLNEVTKDYIRVIREINDKSQKYDVKHNIDVLKSTNKFYQKLCESEQLSEAAEKVLPDNLGLSDEDFAPIKLTKEQEENINSIKREVIGLEGQIDKEAYMEKFEKSGKKSKDDEKEQEAKETEEKKEQEEQRKAEDETIKQIEAVKQEQDKKGFQESIDYVKDLLGLGDDTKEKDK